MNGKSEMKGRWELGVACPCRHDVCPAQAKGTALELKATPAATASASPRTGVFLGSGLELVGTTALPPAAVALRCAHSPTLLTRRKDAVSCTSHVEMRLSRWSEVDTDAQALLILLQRHSHKPSPFEDRTVWHAVRLQSYPLIYFRIRIIY